MSEGNYSLYIDSVQFKEFRFLQHLKHLERVAKWAKPTDNVTAWGRQVEDLAARILQGLGHDVHTTTHKCPWDLWCNQLRVEVKAARYHPRKPRGGRWQAALRNHEADWYLLACLDRGKVIGWFVIPREAIGDRATIAITHPEPGCYRGQWAKYWNNWQPLDQEARMGQLELWK